MAWRRRKANGTAGLRDHGVYLAQTEAGTGGALRGEEWLEGMPSYFICHAEASIGHRYRDVIARSDMILAVGADDLVGGGYRQHTAIRHCVARIQGQVQNC